MPDEKFAIVNLSRLAKVSGINYQKIYNVLVSKLYDTLSENDRTKLSNALFNEVQKIFKTLGFTIEIRRIN